MLMAKDVNENDYLLVVYDGVSSSNGVGMGDMGGYAEMYSNLCKKKDLHKYEENIRNGAKVFEIRATHINEEYAEYLRLKRKFEHEV